MALVDALSFLQREVAAPTFWHREQRNRRSRRNRSSRRAVRDRRHAAFPQRPDSASLVSVSVSRSSRLATLAFRAMCLSALLGACAMTTTERAQGVLDRMRPESYYSIPVQAEFVDAVGRGEIDRARRSLSNGAQVDAIGSEAMTPLYWAIIKQRLSGFQFLLDQGADRDPLTCKGSQPGECTSAIELAAKLEDARHLVALLDAGANPDLEINGTTAMYSAILHRRMHNSRLLAERGANLDRQSPLQRATVISDAVSMNAFAPALLLLQLGADPTIRDGFDGNAVDIVKQFGNAGTVIGSDDEKAYPEFIAELNRRGYWE